MKAEITTLTPVHIGNGITYNRSIDFIEAGSRIGIIDEKKVLKFIGEDNIHQWVAAINAGNNSFINLLKNRNWDESKLEEICSRINNLIHKNSNATQLKEQFRSSLKGMTIPGSSLKGALRTAIFYSFLDDKFFENKTIDFIRTFNAQRQRYIWDDSDIMKLIFGNNPNEDTGRFIKSGDAHFENTTADVYELQILNKTYQGWVFKSDQKTLIETIPENSKATFRFSIDMNLLRENKRYQPNLWPDSKIIHLEEGIVKLCKIANKFTKLMIRKEHNAFKNEDLPNVGIRMSNKLVIIFNEHLKKCQENEMIIRVGAHSGYNFITGKWIDDFEINFLDDDSYNSLRCNIQKNIDYSDMEIWPKTRKISTNGDVFGFVKITFH